VCPGIIRVVVKGVPQKRSPCKADEESHASPPTKAKNFRATRLAKLSTAAPRLSVVEGNGERRLDRNLGPCFFCFRLSPGNKSKVFHTMCFLVVFISF